MKKVPSFGKTFVCIDDKNNREICKKLKLKIYLLMGLTNILTFKIKNIIF